MSSATKLTSKWSLLVSLWWSNILAGPSEAARQEQARATSASAEHGLLQGPQVSIVAATHWGYPQVCNSHRSSSAPSKQPPLMAQYKLSIS